MQQNLFLSDFNSLVRNSVQNLHYFRNYHYFFQSVGFSLKNPHLFYNSFIQWFYIYSIFIYFFFNYIFIP